MPPDAAASNALAAGASAESVGALLAMHVDSAAITVWALTTLPVAHA